MVATGIFPNLSRLCLTCLITTHVFCGLSPNWNVMTALKCLCLYFIGKILNIIIYTCSYFLTFSVYYYLNPLFHLLLGFVSFCFLTEGNCVMLKKQSRTQVNRFLKPKGSVQTFSLTWIKQMSELPRLSASSPNPLVEWSCSSRQQPAWLQQLCGGTPSWPVATCFSSYLFSLLTFYSIKKNRVRIAWASGHQSL